MEQTLKRILLIDDDEAANFVHQLVVAKVCAATRIDTALNGAEALRILERLQLQKAILPDLILLDLNMPVMNGWEFLVKYGELNPDHPNIRIYLMLATPLSPTDALRACELTQITGVIQKPFKERDLKEIL